QPDEITPPRFADTGGSGQGAAFDAYGYGARSSGRAEFRDSEQASARDAGDVHSSYEDEDQPVAPRGAATPQRARSKTSVAGPKYNSIDNIAEFFASRGKKFTRPQVPVEAPAGKTGFRPGQRVRHPKYGE